MLNKEKEQPLGNIFKNRSSEAKDNLEQKIKRITLSGLSLKRKRKSIKFIHFKSRKVKDIFTEVQ